MKYIYDEILSKNNLNVNHHHQFSDLFSLLIAKLPSNNRSSNYKVNSSNRKYASHWSLDHHKFIQFNSKSHISMLLLDFDKISPDETVRDRFPTPKLFWEHFLSEYLSSEPNVITQTDKGYQVLIILDNWVRTSHFKSFNLLQYILKGMIDRIPFIDAIATRRTRGIIRNPLAHNHWEMSLEPTSLEEFRYFAESSKKEDEINFKINHKERNDKNEAHSQSLKSALKAVLDESSIIIPEGYRTSIFFQAGMIKAKGIPKDYDSRGILRNYLRNLNLRHLEDQLSTTELERIIVSIAKYHQADKIFVSDPRVKNRNKKESNKKYYEKNRTAARRRDKHLKFVANKKRVKSEKKIRRVLSKGYSFLKFKNGEWNMSAIARRMKRSVNTVKKYLKELKKFKPRGERKVSYKRIGCNLQKDAPLTFIRETREELIFECHETGDELGWNKKTKEGRVRKHGEIKDEEIPF